MSNYELPVGLLEDDDIPYYGDNYEAGKSKNSIHCLLVRTTADGKREIGVSKQQRSPFINRKEIDEFFYEDVGGMIEDSENYEEDLKREVVEETGVEITNGRLTQLSGLIAQGKATEEATIFFIYEMNGSENINKLSLDDQESIGELEWFPLENIDLNTFHVHLPTKYSISLAREFFSKEEQLNCDEPR